MPLNLMNTGVKPYFVDKFNDLLTILGIKQRKINELRPFITT